MLRKNIFLIQQAKAPVNVAVTGASGNIAYALLFRIASGQLLGKDQPVNLHLIDIPPMEKKLSGVKMELDDCAFPLLNKVVTTSKLNVGFNNVDVAFLVGNDITVMVSEKATHIVNE